MAIDKELFYASQGLIYPVVARPYTDDMVVKEKVYTKDEVVAMLTEIKLKLEEKSFYYIRIFGKPENEKRVYMVELDDVNDTIQNEINALKGE